MATESRRQLYLCQRRSHAGLSTDGFPPMFSLTSGPQIPQIPKDLTFEVKSIRSGIQN